MGVYIKGMEIPCEEAEPMRIELYADGTVIVIKEQDDFYEFKAVPVPLHGRLIDALWVRDQIIKQWMDYSDDSHMYKRGMEDAYEVIRNAPTVIEAEEGLGMSDCLSCDGHVMGWCAYCTNYPPAEQAEEGE